MNQLLLDPSQRQVVNGITWLAAVLLAASALFGQAVLLVYEQMPNAPICSWGFFNFLGSRGSPFQSHPSTSRVAELPL